MQGFVHLMCILLVSGLLQLSVKQYLKYGIVIDFNMSCMLEDAIVASFLVAFVYAASLSVWLIMKSLQGGMLSTRASKFASAVAQLLIYGVPIAVIFRLHLSPMLSIVVCAVLVVVSLKTHSYMATNLLLLKHHRKGTPVDDVFPRNLTIGDFIYFLAAPTLVYETHFPRNDCIRYWWAAKEFVACGACVAMSHVVFTQFMLPVLQQQDSSNVFYDLIRLSIPSIVAWLLGFYAFFHCFLNGIAELLRYADRCFYEDWYNAATLDVFWRKWNMLVHEWLLRHVYLQSMRSAKASHMTATFITFFFSAVYHELIFFVGFQVLRPWLFLAMFAQIPLILFSKFLNDKILSEGGRERWGNVYVWLSLFLGHPLIEALYLREYLHYNQSLFCSTA